MRQRIEAMRAAAALLAVTTGLSMAAWAQAPTLAEQLAAQYKLVKMGSDSSGTAVVEEGTLLEVKKGGILGVPYSDKTVLTTKYEDGTVHGPNVALTEARKRVFGHFSQTANQGQTTALVKKGDKVYPTKMEVNVDKDQVIMGIVECDTCNKTDPPTYNKANVVFQFAKGSLAKTSAGEVEDTIGQLLAISDTSADQGGGDQGGQQGGQQQGGQQGGGQQAQQQQEPQTVQMGMSPDQVIAALGKPDQQFNVGPKQIFVYKTAGVKVTFFGGKVVDVQ